MFEYDKSREIVVVPVASVYAIANSHVESEIDWNNSNIIHKKFIYIELL